MRGARGTVGKAGRPMGRGAVGVASLRRTPERMASLQLVVPRRAKVCRVCLLVGQVIG